MNKYTLVVALAAYASLAHADGRMSLEEAQQKVLTAQSHHDGLKEQLKKLDLDLRRTTTALDGVSMSSSDVKEKSAKTNMLNKKLKRLIAQRSQLLEQQNNSFEKLKQSLRDVGRKHNVSAYDGKYIVSERKKPVRPRTI